MTTSSTDLRTPDFATRLPLAATLLLVASVWSSLGGTSVRGSAESRSVDVVLTSLAVSIIFVCLPCLRRGPIGPRLASLFLIFLATVLLATAVVNAVVSGGLTRSDDWIFAR